VSLRSQKVFIWWSLILTAFYFIALRFLLHMPAASHGPVVGGEIARSMLNTAARSGGRRRRQLTGGCFVRSSSVHCYSDA